MKRMKLFPVILGICVCMVSFTSCIGPDSISESTIPLQETDTVVVGADGMGETYSVNESGMLYCKSNTIRYYDVAADEEYILCSKVNCSHSNDECGAWYKNSTDISGLALYGGRIWFFRKNEAENKWELISMEPTGKEQQTEVSLDIGNVTEDSWVLTSIADVCYSGDRVVAGLEYKYIKDNMDLEQNISSRQYVAISLKDGTVTEVNEKTQDPIEYSLIGVSEDDFIFRKRENQIKEMTSAEFEQAYGVGEFPEGTFSSENEEDFYFEYTSKWYPANCGRMESYCRYDLNTQEETVLETVPARMTFDDSGYLIGEVSKYLVSGTYKDSYLACEPDWDNGGVRVFLWNVKSGEKENILDIEDGGLLGFESGQHVYDGKMFLYCNYVDDEHAEISLYDLEKKESRELFTDQRSISFRIIDDTADLFIGKCYIIGNPLMADGYELYKINKDDYYAGKTDRMVKLKLQRRAWE